jgi:hypothetical protein
LTIALRAKIFFFIAPDIFRSTSSFLDTLFALSSNILTYESSEDDAPGLRAHRGILLMVSWRSRLTIGDVVGATLRGINLGSQIPHVVVRRGR